MRLPKWTLFCALLVVAALSLAGCMNSGNRADTAMPSPSAGATAGTGSVGDPEGANQSGLQNGAGTGAATPFDWARNAAQVETAINQISEISDSRVVEMCIRDRPYGVSRIDERLIRLLRTERGFLIGPRTAEEVKNALASAHGAAPVPMRAAGLNLQTRLPMLFDVEPEMVWRAAEGVLTELVGMVASVVDNAPEELAADLNDAVCVLAGGGALISGLDKRLGDHLGCLLYTSYSYPVARLQVQRLASRRWRNSLACRLSQRFACLLALPTSCCSASRGDLER